MPHLHGPDRPQEEVKPLISFASSFSSSLRVGVEEAEH